MYHNETCGKFMTSNKPKAKERPHELAMFQLVTTRFIYELTEFFLLNQKI